MVPVRLRLRELRKRAGLTQEQLANKIGATQATISKQETGSLNISYDLIERLADALGVEPGQLFERVK